MSAITTNSTFGQTQSGAHLNIVQRHPLISYFILAVLISGLIWFPLIAVTQGWTNAPIPFALHYLGAFGPMFAALIMTAYLGGTAGLKELWARITRWRVGWIGFIGGVVMPIGFWLIGAFANVVSGLSFPDLNQLSQVNYLPDIGLLGVSVLWLVTYGFGEEIGWRGFALPRLQKSHSALTASFLVWLMWSAWHIPYFFYLDTYVKLGFVMFPFFALGILAGTIYLTWLYNETKGSVFIVAVWHAVFDLLSAAKVSDGLIAMVTSTGIMVLAIIIVLWLKPKNLARQPRHSL